MVSMAEKVLIVYIDNEICKIIKCIYDIIREMRLNELPVSKKQKKQSVETIETVDMLIQNFNNKVSQNNPNMHLVQAADSLMKRVQTFLHGGYNQLDEFTVDTPNEYLGVLVYKIYELEYSICI